jgi:hypothetical protein
VRCIDPRTFRHEGHPHCLKLLSHRIFVPGSPRG